MNKRWAVFISGNGSNLNALLESDALDVVLVVSSKKDAYGLKRARRAGVKTHILDKKIDWENLDQMLRLWSIDYIFLAGFMRIVPSEFIEKWRSRILNVHPSYLPHHPGLESIQRAFESGVHGGVTVHEVTADMDAGPIVIQKAIDSKPGMSLKDFELKVHAMEHRLVQRGSEMLTRSPQGFTLNIK